MITDTTAFVSTKVFGKSGHSLVFFWKSFSQAFPLFLKTLKCRCLFHKSTMPSFNHLFRKIATINCAENVKIIDHERQSLFRCLLSMFHSDKRSFFCYPLGIRSILAIFMEQVSHLFIRSSYVKRNASLKFHQFAFFW